MILSDENEKRVDQLYRTITSILRDTAPSPPLPKQRRRPSRWRSANGTTGIATGLILAMTGALGWAVEADRSGRPAPRTTAASVRDVPEVSVPVPVPQQVAGSAASLSGPRAPDAAAPRTASPVVYHRRHDADKGDPARERPADARRLAPLMSAMLRAELEEDSRLTRELNREELERGSIVR